MALHDVVHHYPARSVSYFSPLSYFCFLAIPWTCQAHSHFIYFFYFHSLHFFCLLLPNRKTWHTPSSTLGLYSNANFLVKYFSPSSPLPYSCFIFLLNTYSHLTYYILGLFALFIVLLSLTRIKAPRGLGFGLFCSLL